MDEPLSEREIEILRLAADGRTNAEIAVRLALAMNTVKWYTKRIYEKLAVENRVQAIKRAETLGLLNGAGGQSEPAPPYQSLPSPLTAFVGRRAEVDAVKQLLRQHRLLTLTGPGGIGKTRLALRAAEEMAGFYKDGIYFVDLAPINEANLVVNTIAHVLGVAESLDTPLLALTQAAIRSKQLLLVLDNFEHVIEAAPAVADLLAAARELTVLVTSRELLALYGEQEYVVPPLKLPDLERFAAHHLAPGALLSSEALQLFERCAQAAYADFRVTAENAPAVATICLRLNGLPLAIELAAAYAKLLSPQAMLLQLDSMWLEMSRSLRNVPARQQTLRNTIEWSYRFLNDDERQLFAQLAVFRGGCAFDAIAEICAIQSSAALLQALNGLVTKSLVWRRNAGNDEPRFGMLETIREFALLCLDARGEVAVLQQRHALYYTRYAYRVEAALADIQQRLVLNQIEIEVDNFRAALRWALDHDPEPGVRMIGDLCSCWRIRGYLTEGMDWAQQLLVAKPPAPAPVQSRAYANAAVLALILGQRSQARQMAEHAYLLAQQAVDRQTRGQALQARVTTRIAPDLLAADYEELGVLADEAARLYVEIENWPGHGRVLNLLGDVKRVQQRYAEAKRFYEESLRVLRTAGYLSDVVVAHSNLGWTDFHMGQHKAAFANFVEGLDLAHELDFPHGIAMTLLGAAGVLARQEHWESAAKLIGAAAAIQESIGIVMVPSDEPDYGSTVSELRAQLGQADYEHWWQTGHRLTAAEATIHVKEFC
jgi:predicted ATPase/DNA-binding CsgD family transcriptional regulator